jgi:hypothetical protein
MEGKIKNGILYIKRNFQGEATECGCLYDNSEEISCGIWCPLFGEPEASNGKFLLTLCKRTLVFAKLAVE